MPDDPTTPRREPRIAVAASWCCLIVSFVLSAITWVALGRIAGYGTLAYLMPFVVDAYVVGSIVTWLHPVGARVARFAYYNMYGAAAIGVASQAIYHCASVYATTQSVWQAGLALIVGSIPPLFAFLGVHLRGLARRELNDQQNNASISVESLATAVPLQALPATSTPSPPDTATPAAPAIDTQALSGPQLPVASPPQHSIAPAKAPEPARPPRLVPPPNNVQARVPGFASNDDRRQTVIRLLRQGHLTQSAIARRTGASLRMVQHNAKQLGLTKPRGERKASA